MKDLPCDGCLVLPSCKARYFKMRTYQIDRFIRLEFERRCDNLVLFTQDCFGEEIPERANEFHDFMRGDHGPSALTMSWV